RLVVRLFSFASSSDRIQSTADLKFDGTATRLSQALDRARDELAGLPLAGLVMISDGADTTDAAIDESLASLKARSIPVFTVGVGQEQFARDIQVTRVETVLYYEGEPRVELKFVRRAVAEDKNLQLVTLDRTAENKYLRQGVSNSEELIAGFPKTREELFAYRALVLGSVEAASFTPEQLRMIADFVSKRGGSLLMLGGRRAFAEGGWAGTPVGEVL